MNYRFLGLFLFSFTFGFSQVKGFVFNKNSKKPIAYASIWVEDGDVGTSSNTFGRFNLKEISTDLDKNLVVSALGFDTKKINITKLKDTVFLNPKNIVINAVSIKRKKKKKLLVNKIIKSNTNFFYSSGEMPWMVGRYFPYERRYNATPFIESFRIQTKSEKDNVKFNVRIYKKGKDNNSHIILHDNNIIAIARKGNKITKIDISDLNIIMPKEGIIIMLEWLFIRPNKQKHKILFSSSGEKTEIVGYEPKFGTISVKDNSNSWMFRKGKWTLTNKIAEEKIDNKYNLLAAELILSN